MLKKFVRIYDEVEAKVLVASLVFTVLIIFLQIVMRSIFNSSLSWSEELARYIFIWQIWLGMSIGVRDNKHIKVEILFQYVHGRGEKIIKIVATILAIFMCGFLVWYGAKMTNNAMTRNSLSAAMRFPLWIVYLSLPFSSLVTGLRYICVLGDQIKNFNTDAEAPVEG
ncbi:TRAP transporter small permease [Deltaproteobacteria bacterium Smac51]|nr:TRAP transporter small permease [Deltaproteobacteria bacterium Smac51]